MVELLHFDIETTSEYENFESFKENDERGSALFEAKCKKMNWIEKFGSIEQAYIENGGIISTYGKIICISFGFTVNGEKRIKSLYSDNEKDLVNKFNESLKYIEKKAFHLCGFRIKHFDIPWILHKLHKYGIEPVDMIYVYDKKPWEMRVADMSDDWKTGYLLSHTFDEMCYELGVESPKNELDGSKVHKAYWSGNLDSVVKYCESDVSSSIDAGIKLYKHYKH